MNELQLIKSEHFGEIEADIYSNGDDMFMTSGQLCACLNESRGTFDSRISRNAYLRNKEFSVSCKLQGADGKMYTTRLFTEDGVYEITMLSDSEKAQEFRAWIRQILKALRRGQGVRISEARQKEATAKFNNSRARVANLWLKIAENAPEPEYKQVCAAYASQELAGKPVLPLPEAGERHFSATEVGAFFGITSQKVGTLSNSHSLKTEQYGKWYHDKSPYSAKQVDTFKYNWEGIKRFAELLGKPAPQRPLPNAS